MLGHWSVYLTDGRTDGLHKVPPEVFFLATTISGISSCEELQVTLMVATNRICLFCADAYDPGRRLSTKATEETNVIHLGVV